MDAGKPEIIERKSSSGLIAAHACGKFILTGEHAVVYGRPAIACPLRTYNTDVWIDAAEDQDWREQLHPLVKHSLKVIGLDQYFADHPNQQLYITTNVPIAIGLGASAALVAALVKLSQKTDGKDLPFERQLALAKRCEDFAHGKSSGLDVAVALRERAVLYEKGEAQPLPEISLPPIELVNSGMPGCSTRDCVLNVAKNFSDNAPIWQDFEDVCRDIVKNGVSAAAIRQNHRLLCRIGVVPETVKDFIARIEKRGGAAKISGAGSIHLKGKGAGIILALGIHETDLQDLCHDFGYGLRAG